MGCGRLNVCGAGSFVDAVRGRQPGSAGKGNPVKRSSGDGEFVDGRENAVGG